MAPHIQPSSLLSLSRVQVASNLANTCRILQVLAQDTCVAYVLTLTRNYLRPIWQSLVPNSIRAQLLEKTAALLNSQNSDGTGTSIGAAPLYLLGLLLAPDIRKLRVELCCYYGCSHQTALLKFLATEGKGLETLELARSTLLRLDRSLLQSVLVAASSLKYLTFRNIGSDSILQIIGSHCPNLVSLDTSHSREVTDAGLQQLFLRVEFRDKSTKLPNKLNSLGEKKLLDKCKNTIHSFAKVIRKACQIERKTDAKNLIMVLEYYEKRNNLCSTLKYLNIANTAVTSAGILLAICQVPELESLGEYCHIGRALELLEQTTAEETTIKTYKLKCINTSRATVHRLQLISSHFPTLYKLKVSEPMHPPASLFLIPESVISLHLQSIPPTAQWIQGIYDYLNGSQGKRLRELSLRFLPGDTLPNIDLGCFLSNCIDLYTLNIDGANIDWQINKSNTNQLLYLQKIQLGRMLSLNCLCNILKTAPYLRIAHVYSCFQLKAEDICNFSKINDIGSIDIDMLSSIECFYIYETVCLSQDTLKVIIDKFPNLNRIGNIRNCGLHYTDVQSLDKWIKEKNLHLELSAGSHWFSSNCFPI